MIPWFPQREGCTDFDIAEKHPQFVGLTEAILESGWSTLYSMVMFSNKDTLGRVASGLSTGDKSKFNLNRLVYSMDIDDAVGGKTQVVPGTHKGGAITVGPWR